MDQNFAIFVKCIMNVYYFRNENGLSFFFFGVLACLTPEEASQKARRYRNTYVATHRRKPFDYHKRSMK